MERPDQLRQFAGVLGLIALELLGCGNRDPLYQCHESTAEAVCEPTRRASIDPFGDSHQWVITSIRLPEVAREATASGFDLDSDCRVDNALGQIQAAMTGLLGVSPNSIYAAMIGDGQLIQLIEVRAVSLENALGVGMGVHVGMDADDEPSNNLGGQGVFVRDDQFSSIELVGRIDGGRLTAQLGRAPFPILFGESVAATVVTLRAAAAELTFDGDTIEGKLGGVLTRQQVEDELLPSLWQGFDAAIARDCPTIPCTANSAGETLLRYFDTNPKDGQVSLEELRNSNLLRSLLRPDVDLFDSEGRHNPQCDGEKDALSFGVSFTAVRASF